MDEPAIYPPPDDERITPLDWANEVLWAAKRINLKRLDGKTCKGRPPSSAPPGVTAGQFALWQFGRDNVKDLMTNLVPKALAIVQKHTARDNDQEMVAEEEKSVKEMRDILARAIVEAANCA